MTPVIPCSISSVPLIPGVTFTIKNTYLTRCNFSNKPRKHEASSHRFSLPLSTSLRLFPQYRRWCPLDQRYGANLLSATGTDLAVEEPDSPVADEDSSGTLENPSNAAETSEKSSTNSDASPTTTQSKRTRPGRKSEMPPVKNEELVVGATYTGKVRSIQPFGAFVDFGAFTDGLVHVSRLSNSFVKDVRSVVSIGQEVKVRLVEVNMETGRISLTMRESDDSSKVQQRKDGPANSDKQRPTRRNTSKSSQRREEVKSSKFVKGQDLEGTVKNLTRSGAFISLPEGEEGFLPASEESDDGLGSMMGGSSLQVGQEVSVRVLRITRGQVTLTMKKGEGDEKFDAQFSQGVVHAATNPFLLAFRKNEDVAAFLDEREKVARKPADTSTSGEADAGTSTPEVKDQPLTINEQVVGESSAVDEIVEEDEASSEEIDAAIQTIEKETEENSETSVADVNLSTENQLVEVVEGDGLPDSSQGTDSQVLSAETPKSNELTENQVDDIVVKDEVQVETGTTDDKTIPEARVEEEVGAISDKNENVTSSVVQSDIASSQEVTSDGISDPSPDSADDQLSPSESQVVEEAAETQNNNIEDKAEAQTLVANSEMSEIPASGVEEVESSSGKNGSITNSNGSSPSEATKAISPALVKQLREETGAGMMECKKALTETGGDITKAQEFLRKKGLASAEKKASRVTAEGRIGSYIHDSRIGVLVEVNCETDFVSRGDIFKALVDDLAMQVAACPQVKYLVTEDIPEEIVNKEKEIEIQKEDLLSKPEQIRSKIVEGRIRKRLEELALLEQPYIKDDKVVVKDWVKQTIATIGENIKVKRFVRYNLGEGLEKKSQDFAAEVAAQTAQRAVPTSEKKPTAVVEDKEIVEKEPTVAISAALVKQLREETGAGMMDCKKALSETGGDIEKAQEYLRKKGLSTADKKSSRIAAEGRIGSYIHDSRIGVLIEVNCETDFVGRSEKFKELVDDLAMQVVACPQVNFVSIEEIPESIVTKEKELEMQREDILSKPENIREKIVEGRVSKRLGELALLEQPFIKNDSLLVKDMVKQIVAALGENIKVRRFVKFTLGETTETPKTEEAKA